MSDVPEKVRLSGAPYLVDLANRLRGAVTRSGGIDLRDPQLLYEAADALCDFAALHQEQDDA